ncbi:type III-B CRISPR module RAMP protein Cmr4 [Herpetosiphon llansteffanensis]
MQTHLIFVHALSPIHAGTGQSVDVIDMPIAREKATNLPYIPGSSVKGVIRDVYADLEKRKSVFGTEEQAGDAIFADQRLLLLPIRSLYGTFAWVTSPYVLNRFAREAKTCFADSSTFPTIHSGDTIHKDANDPSKNKALALITQQSVLSGQATVYLEDLDIPAEAKVADEWATWLGQKLFAGDDSWQTILQERLCIVPDEIFNFLVTTATEITARIRLDDDTKVVEKGGLWYEEALPAETILAGIVAINDQKGNKNTAAVDAALEQVAQQNLIQFGGNATVGRGLCRLALVKGDRK